MTIFFFHVNAYKHLTIEGLPFAVIRHGSDANPGPLYMAMSTLPAGSTRFSTRSARQKGLTPIDYFFHVNASKHLTVEGLPFAVIQLGSDANQGLSKEALNHKIQYISQ